LRQSQVLDSLRVLLHRQLGKRHFRDCRVSGKLILYNGLRKHRKGYRSGLYSEVQIPAATDDAICVRVSVDSGALIRTDVNIVPRSNVAHDVDRGSTARRSFVTRGTLRHQTIITARAIDKPRVTSDVSVLSRPRRFFNQTMAQHRGGNVTFDRSPKDAINHIEASNDV
jgi:hypothetical protein